MKLNAKTGFAAIAMLGITFFAFVCRFWGLSRFNSPVFDETYFAQFAYDYVNRTEFFDTHPPLGKYIIAIGIRIFQLLPVSQAGGGTEGVSQISAFGYRWIGAAFGTLVPLWVGILAYKIGHRVSFALFAAALTALDGLLLVESRYALINIYLLTFGLLGQICFLMAVDRKRGRAFWLILSGIGFGASWAVKWNGLGFLLAVYGFYGFALILSRIAPTATHDPPAIDPDPADPDDSASSVDPANSADFDDPADSATTAANAANAATVPADRRLPPSNALRGAARIPIPLFGLTLGLVPAIVYRLSWVYHLNIAPEFNFWQMQQQILGYHANVGGNTAETHPYCSPWFSWPWAIRPMSYYFDRWDAGDRVMITDVHALGTPLLWWFSTLAIAATIAIVAFWLGRIVLRDRVGQLHLASAVNLVSPIHLSVGSFLAFSYGANLLPWALVSRCTYIYHYMGASVFSFIALAWVLDRVWQRPELVLRAIAPTFVLACFVAFAFWLPIFLGLPISSEAFELRMWMDSWY